MINKRKKILIEKFHVSFKKENVLNEIYILFLLLLIRKLKMQLI